MIEIRKVLEDSKINFKENVSLKKFTTTKVGGKAKYFVVVKKENDFVKIFNLVKKYNVNYLIIGGGSNLLISDEVFKGIVILNRVIGISLEDEYVNVKSGTSLIKLVRYSVNKGLLGLEDLAGIPGTVGGGIYGNAGAYGKSVSDCLEKVKITDGNKTYWLTKKDCIFSYRDSNFKKDKKLILEVRFKLTRGNKKVAKDKFDKVLEDRQKKYKRGIYCPGSFFKNIEAKDLSKFVLSKIPTEKIVYGKIPAGFLLESVSAKGFKVGNIEVSEKHANFFINKGGGSAKDFYNLAMILKKKVFEKYGISLEPEVQVIGFKNE